MFVKVLTPETVLKLFRGLERPLEGVFIVYLSVSSLHSLSCPP